MEEIATNVDHYSVRSAAAGSAPGGAAQDVVALRGMEFFAHHGVLPEVRPAALPAAARPPPPPAPRPRVG